MGRNFTPVIQPDIRKKSFVTPDQCAGNEIGFESHLIFPLFFYVITFFIWHTDPVHTRDAKSNK